MYNIEVHAACFAWAAIDKASFSMYYYFLLPIECHLNRIARKTSWILTVPQNIESSHEGNKSIELDIKVSRNHIMSEIITPAQLRVGRFKNVKLSVDKHKLEIDTNLLL